MEDGKAHGGNIKLNYVEASNFMPLTVINDIVTEAAFSGTQLVKGESETTLVLFTIGQDGKYVGETHVFDKNEEERTHDDSISGRSKAVCSHESC